ncbi:hypothetical protein PHMEG_00034478 [Phytophthora megakarya]|uniref:Uncharacterized protein n=1 Tax=Phytophthora megakarya TaxID=4795 RepID=A0A225UQY3_9STRA|nr:hypothetical protein PHMEG_00034478 [Phytophthora megakarya]
MEEIKSSTEGRPRTTTQATEAAVADEAQHRRHVVVEGTGISRGSSKEVARLHPASRRGKAPAQRRAQRAKDPGYPEDDTPPDSSDGDSVSEDSGDDEPDENSNGEGGGADGSSSGSEMESDGGQERRVQRPREQRVRRKNVKDLELPTFVPSPKVSVSTWIDRVDLALKEADGPTKLCTTYVDGERVNLVSEQEPEHAR